MHDYYSLLREIMLNGETLAPRGEEIKELIHVQLKIDPYNCIYHFDGVREKDNRLIAEFNNKYLIILSTN